jgi:hypothetical protein
MSRYGYATDGRALRMCNECGSMVGDTIRHDRFHDRLESMDALTVTTSVQLLTVVQALLAVTDEARDEAM